MGWRGRKKAFLPESPHSPVLGSRKRESFIRNLSHFGNCGRNFLFEPGTGKGEQTHPNTQIQAKPRFPPYPWRPIYPQAPCEPKWGIFKFWPYNPCWKYNTFAKNRHENRPAWLPPRRYRRVFDKFRQKSVFPKFKNSLLGIQGLRIRNHADSFFSKNTKTSANIPDKSPRCSRFPFQIQNPTEMPAAFPQCRQEAYSPGRARTC